MPVVHLLLCEQLVCLQLKSVEKHDCVLIEKRFLQKCQVYLPNCAKKLLLELLLKIWRRSASYSRKSANVYAVLNSVYEEDR